MRYTNNNSSYRLVCVHTFISIKVFYSTTCSRSTDPTLCSALACFASLKPQAGSQAAGIASAEGARFGSSAWPKNRNILCTIFVH